MPQSRALARGNLTNRALDTISAAYRLAGDPELASTLKQVANGAAGYLAGKGITDMKSLKEAIRPTVKVPRKTRGSASLVTTAAPVSKGVSLYSRYPVISRSARSQRIQYMELVNAGIAGSTGFTLQQQFIINPGISTSFPWLSTIAAQYEQYKVRSLRFHFVPFCPTSTKGVVMMMVDYNVNDPVPATETQFMDHPRAVSTPVWERCSFSSSVPDLHTLGPRKFVRSWNLAGDLKTYDGGVFYLATDNCADTSTLGKLYVEYDIELFTPQLTPSTIAPQGTTVLTAGTQTESTGVSANLTNWTIAYDGLKLTPIINTSTGSITLPKGAYRIQFMCNWKDSTSEITTGEFYMTRNSSIDVGYPYFQLIASGGANQIYSAQYSWVVVSANGTDVFNAVAALTGASGTLTTFDTQLYISLA